MILERRKLDLTIAKVTVVIAVGDACCEFSQVSLSDRLTAHGTKRSRQRPAIDQDEFHCPSPNEKQSKGHVVCTNTQARRILSAVKPAGRSIAPSQTKEPPTMIERLFGMFNIQHRNRE
jgi:hypothetical protein